MPIALDGTCNGLQHYAAMLRDEVGGKAVNLVPSDKPSDVYGDVAKIVRDKLSDLMVTEGPDQWIYDRLFQLPSTKSGNNSTFGTEADAAHPARRVVVHAGDDRVPPPQGVEAGGWRTCQRAWSDLF